MGVWNEKRGGAPERYKCVSDALLTSASAMCLAPASPILLPGRGDGAVSICANGSMGTKREGGAQLRSNLSSDESFFNASAMGLAPGAAMPVPKRNQKPPPKDPHDEEKIRSSIRKTIATHT